MLTAAVVAFTRHADPALPDRFSAKSGLARLSLVTLGATFAAVCERHPGRRPRLADALRGLALLAPDTRRHGRLAAGGAPGLLAAVTVLLIAWLVVRTWRARPAHPAQRRTAAVAGLAFLAEMAIGLIMQTSGSTMLLLMAYVAAGTVLYAALVVLAALAGLAGEK